MKTPQKKKLALFSVIAIIALSVGLYANGTGFQGAFTTPDSDRDFRSAIVAKITPKDGSTLSKSYTVEDVNPDQWKALGEWTIDYKDNKACDSLETTDLTIVEPLFNRDSIDSFDSNDNSRFSRSYINITDLRLKVTNDHNRRITYIDNATDDSNYFRIGEDIQFSGTSHFKLEGKIDYDEALDMYLGDDLAVSFALTSTCVEKSEEDVRFHYEHLVDG